MKSDNCSGRFVELAAHRGNSKYFPENTLIAFESALKIPVDNLEFDVHMTRDKELILMHDHRVDRTTEGSGSVRSYSTKEIKKLDAGIWKGKEFKGTRIPLLSELLDMISDNRTITINVELKDYPADDIEWAHESADKTIAMIEKYGIAQRCTLNSWSGELLEYVDAKFGHRYRLHGYYPLELMGSNRTRDPYDYLYCICMFGTKEKPVCEKESFAYAASRGVQPWVYYPSDSTAFFDEAILYGARLITSNDPQMTLGYLTAKGCRGAGV